MARVLVVEDNPSNIDLVTIMLENAGHTVLTAWNAENALVLAHTSYPDVILMDIHLPGMDGLEATMLLKQDMTTRAIPIIALTAMAMSGDEERIRLAGCDSYISKPLHYKTLWAMIEAWTDKKQPWERAMSENKAVILIVDDESNNRELLGALLHAKGYTTLTANHGEIALRMAIEHLPDLILLDVMMPVMNGYQVAETLKQCALTARIPIIMISALDDRDSRLKGLDAGAEDFLTKPIDRAELWVRVRNMLRLKEYGDFLDRHNVILEQKIQERTEELNKSHVRLRGSYIETIFTMTRAAEYKDEDTGTHVQRISHYSQCLAEMLGMDSDFVDAIFYSSPMHDIGKIGIADAVLLKPGRFTDEEFEVMKTHSTLGAEILSFGSSPYMVMGAEIALNHHERWEGSGYPRGLKKEAIPLSARIMSICDIYDALRSKRPYKPALSHDRVVEIITKGDGRTEPKHFDPAVLQGFEKCADAFDEIYQQHIHIDI